MASRLPLGSDEVHVWWIELNRMSGGDDLLSPDERARAIRFRLARDRRRWIAAHAALRQILAQYAGGKPEELCLERGAQGKPELTGESPLRFSLSHAGDRAALAVAWQREVGIDLEPCNPELPGREDLAALIATTCTANEIARIEALPEADRLLAFLQHWTLKEAYLKGIGVGLAREPRTVEVSSPTISLIPLPATAPRGRPAGTPPVEPGEWGSDVEIRCQLPRFRTSALPSPSALGEGLGVRDLVGEGLGVRAFVGGALDEGQRRLADAVDSAQSTPLDEPPWTLRLLDPGPGWICALAVAGVKPEVRYCHWPTSSKTIA